VAAVAIADAVSGQVQSLSDLSKCGRLIVILLIQLIHVMIFTEISITFKGEMQVLDWYEGGDDEYVRGPIVMSLNGTIKAKLQQEPGGPRDRAGWNK
jgi:hypothetical protein